jgi:protein TonB
MLHQAKWFGLSLTLHLAVATGLTVAASRNLERTPKTIMVVLENFALPDLQRKATEATIPRLPVPTRSPEQAKPDLTRQRIPQAPPVIPAHEASRVRDLLKAAPEVQVAAATQPKIETVNPAPAAQAKMPLQHFQPAAEERATPEKAQQRYLKEHFAYIRDLIAHRLSYPPMARKMRWSGKVLVAFIIAEDGTVHNIRVLETSGFPILDKGATETVRNVAPFPKPPVRAELVVPITFRMMQ